MSLVLCVTLMLPMLAMLPLTAFANDGSDAESVYSEGESSEIIYIDGVYYHITKKTSYVGYGAYQMNIQIVTTLTNTEKPIRRTSAENGYYTVETTGYYMIELWGGNGSDGGDITYPLVDSYGGEGGDGGYVYAKVYLEAGQTLAFSIGTDGDRTTHLSYGGGENEGGEKGEVGSYEVGGGGGYSALYYFEKDEFDSSWLTENDHWNLPASANISRYVMIAAGGGGGGAAPGLIYASSSLRPNGGSGGNINNDVSMTLSGESYAVEGYIFAGEDGSSSSTVTTYVGRGGSNVPGTSPSTSGNEYHVTSEPNDWSGSYNLFEPIGAGGVGNLRGGGGGAGYCGGSGGVMRAYLIADSVGGGGGGSSFLANKIGNSTVSFGDDLDDESRALLVGEDNCPSDVGGAFAITFAGNDDNASTADTTYLSSVTVNGQISQYFNVYSASAVDIAENPNGTVVINDDGSFTVENVDLSAGNIAEDGTILSLQFALKPKDDFVGGNMVPLLNSLEAIVSKDGTEHIIKSEENVNTDYVNVPLDFYISTNSVMKSLKGEDTSITYNASDLYNPTYQTAIDNFASGNGSEAGWQYTFIEGLSAYTIYEGKEIDESKTVSKNAILTISETTYFTIAMTATAKQDNGYAKVGPKITEAQTFTGIALVGIVSADIFKEGWDYAVTADKTLTFDGENYNFITTVDQSLTSNYQDTSTFQYGDTAAYPIANSGYYLIQAWGASGGNGGSASARNGAGSTSTASGGKGAAGGYVNGFVWLEAGDMLEWTFGTKGSNGAGSHPSTANRTDTAGNATGGVGGAYTVVWLVRGDTRTAIMVAGGGGGGGGGGAGITDLGTKSVNSGYSATQRTSVNYGTSAGTLTSATSNTNYAGKRGNSGNVSFSSILGLISGSSAGSGSSGYNFAHSDYVNKGKTDGETVYMGRLTETLLEGEDQLYTKPATDNSAARVSYICTPQTEEELNNLPGIQTSGTFSRYFEIATDENGIPLIDMDIKGMENIVPVLGETDEDGYTVVTYYDSTDTDLVLAKFSYKFVEDPDSGTIFYDIRNNLYYPTFEISPTDDVQNGYVAHSGFSLVITLKPREGFLGGNDVPLLQDSGDPDESCVSISYEGGQPCYLTKNEAVDFANVAIQYDLADDFRVKDGEILLGDGDTSNDSVSTDDLYELTTNLAEMEEWRKEFVELVLPETEMLDVNTEMPYDITVWLRPKAQPEKATVVGATDGLSVTLPVMIYVKYYVIYNMDHMTYTGETAALRDTLFETTLLAEEGYAQPPLEENGIKYITVMIDGVEITDFTYDETTGAFSLPGQYVTAPIEITASAKGKEYKIKYVYTLDGITSIEHEDIYMAGDIIDYSWFNAQVIPERIGYSMVWEWDTVDASQPVEMPANDVLVTGTYEKNRYNLTVKYVDSAGNPLCEDHTELVTFEDEFRVPTPNVDGYIPDSMTVSDAAVDVAAAVENDPMIIRGTMGTGDITVTVTFLSAANRLVILYLAPDDRELAQRVDITLTENSTYSYVSPEIEGYTPDPELATVSGQMLGAESKFIKVYYTPNRYTVNLEFRYEGMSYPGPREEGVDLPYDFTTATMNGMTGITVEYDNIYGYNAATGSYGMPTPLVLGYSFGGWYTDTTYTTEVNESMTVKITEDTTFYAKWIPTKYRLTLRYDFAFDEGDFEPNYENLADYANLSYHPTGNYYYIQFEYCEGQSYEFIMGQIVGYTPYTDYGLATAEPVGEKLSGTMPASHKMLQVTYGINSYTIRFMDVLGENLTYPEGDDPGENIAPFDTVWQTVVVKHGVCPEYNIATPEYIYDPLDPKAYLEYYTYTFTHWIKAGTDTTFDPSTTQFDVAVSDQDYYAAYTATENVAYVIDSSLAVVGYYDSVQEAVDVAAAYLSSSTTSAPIVKLRRNGTADTVDLTLTEENHTVTVGTDTSYYVGFDLNGYRLVSDRTALQNNMRLYLYDSVGTGEICVSGEGDVTAVQNGLYYLYLGYNLNGENVPVTIKAISQSGDARAVYSTGSTIYQYSGSVIAESGSGNAYGIEFYKANTTGSSTYTYVYGSVSATSQSGDAYGVKTNFGVQFNTGATVNAKSVSGRGDAYGVYLYDNTSCSVYLNNEGITINAESDRGNAYGVRALGTFAAPITTATTPCHVSAASANGNAYGIYVIRLTGSLCSNVTATAPNGKAVGLQANGTGYQNIGSANYMYTIRAVGNDAIAAEYIYHAYLRATLIAEGKVSAIGLRTMDSTHTNYVVQMYDNASIQAISENGNAYALKDARVSFSNTGAPCSITASTASGNAYAAYNSYITAYTTEVTIASTATTGNAYGFAVDADAFASGLTMPYNTAITATATEGGTAYGAYISGSTTVSGSVTAIADNAYGLYAANGATAILDATAVVNAESASAAYGVYIESGAVAQAVGGSTVNATATEGGTAYGIYNMGTVSSFGATVNAISEAAVYGFANMGGEVDGVLSTLNVTATSTGEDSYAFYNSVSNLGTGVLAGSLNGGVFTAVAPEGKTGYGIYAADGTTVYISGSQLHYKGSSDTTHRNEGVLVVKGFVEALCDTHTEYLGYYHLVSNKYIMVFQITDPTRPGEIIAEYEREYHTDDTALADGVPYLASDLFTGYTSVWESYTFDAPEGDAEKKYVLSIHTLNVYTMYFHTGVYINGTENIVAVQYTYTEATAAIDESQFGGTKYGYVFGNAWNDANSTLYVFGTMPAEDVHLSAVWNAGTFTITFITNGGTEISPITGKYGTSISVPDPIKPGFVFDGWYSDEGLTNYYSVYQIPGEDITLYASWEDSISLIILGKPMGVTVRLDINFDGVCDENDTFDGETPAAFEMVDGEFTVCDVSTMRLISAIPAYALSSSQNKHCVLVGWSDKPNGEGGKIINIASGVGSWGITPVNGYIDLYPVVKELDGVLVSDNEDLTTLYDAIVSFDYNITNGELVELTDGITADFACFNKNLNDAFGMLPADTYTADNALAVTYRALIGGEQTIMLLPFAVSRNIYITVTLYSGTDDPKVISTTTIKTTDIIENIEDMPTITVDMNEGDVIVIKMYDDASTGDDDSDSSLVLTLIDSPASIETDMDAMNLYSKFMLHNAKDFLFYSSSMGTIDLPIKPTPGYENVSGWRYMENGSYSEPITSIDPSIFTKTDIWTALPDLGITALILNQYIEGQIEVGSWLGAIVPGRHFSTEIFDSEMNTTAKVRPNGALTFAFIMESVGDTSDNTVLKFANGLPAGTTLSMMIQYGTTDYADFYYYIVEEDGMKEIPLNLFTRMGKPDEAHSGFAPVMIFNIAYPTDANMQGSESVTVSLGGTDIGVSLTYDFVQPTVIKTEDNPEYLTIPPMAGDETLYGNLPIPSFKNAGFSPFDRVTVVMHMEDREGNIINFPASLVMAASVRISANWGTQTLPAESLYMFNDYLIADWIVTVAEVEDLDLTIRGEMVLEALRYHGFDGILVYDIAVVPSGADLAHGNFISAEAYLHTEYRLDMKMIDAPEITVSESSATVAQGDVRYIDVLVGGQSGKNFDLYVYQLDENGHLTTNDACKNIINGVDPDDTGKAEGQFQSGTNLPFYVKEDAPPGRYFLVAYYGDQYAVYVLNITESADNS